ncbi:MAG: flagellar assembly protein FliH [Rhodobacteraceae bacterium HLUCCO18]|nr:MAG: flagellar assembly protein FliH [Rhodobacteraceae bacterium HLUCCO18]
MMRALILEDFAQPETGPTPGPAPHFAVPDAPPPEGVQQEAETVGLDAFDQGYRSGWDDCIANETEERRRIGADLGAALSEIALTAETVRRELLASIAPVLEGIAGQLLPRMAAEAVAPILVEEIRTIVAGQDPLGLKVLASPQKCTSIEALIEASTELAVTVVPEPAYAEGQVSIRFADQRRDIDLSEAAARMAELIRAFAAGTDTAKPQFGSVPHHADRGVAR